jgi:hypothetical protein
MSLIDVAKEPATDEQCLALGLPLARGSVDCRQLIANKRLTKILCRVTSMQPDLQPGSMETLEPKTYLLAASSFFKIGSRFVLSTRATPVSIKAGNGEYGSNPKSEPNSFTG